jgi:O-antigen/teichoic acid export membrane protein
LVVLKELNETEYGIYSSAQLFSSYILFFVLGLQTNLAVKISKSKDLKMKDDEVNATLTYFILILIIGSLSILLYQLFDDVEFNKVYLPLVFLISLKALVIQKFFIVILRTSKQIRILSYSQIFIVLISLLQLVFFKHLGIVFINYLLIVECLISIYLYSRFTDVKLGLNFSSIPNVLRDGISFWKVNIFFSLFPVVVSSIALKSLSLEDFGKFSVFYVAINMFSKLTSSVDKINYIDISGSYPDLKKVRPRIIFKKNLLFIALMYVLVLIAFLNFGEYFLSLMLPTKISLYPILVISILTSAVGLFNFLNVYFDVMEKFSLKYINIVLKFVVMVILVGLFSYVGKLTVLNLCITVLASEFSASVANLFIIKKYTPAFFNAINEK